LGFAGSGLAVPRISNQGYGKGNLGVINVNGSALVAGTLDKELHGPDRMYLDANQIIFVEPVGPDSKVAQLINEANKQQ